jgi:hypothetical protein
MFAFSIARRRCCPQLSQPIHSFEIIETMFARLGRLRMRRFPYESQTERAGPTPARS